MPSSRGTRSVSVATRPRCLACDALSQIIEVYVHQDSLTQAVAAARDWIARQPSSGRAWQALSAGRRSTELRGIDAHGTVFGAITDIYAEDWAAADAQLAGLARAAGPDILAEFAAQPACRLLPGALGEGLGIEHEPVHVENDDEGHDRHCLHYAARGHHGPA